MRKRSTKRMTGIIAAAAAAVVLAVSGLPLAAASNVTPDPGTKEEHPISLTATMQYGDEPDVEKIEGAGLEIYKVADLQWENGIAVYVSTADFEECGIEYDKIQNQEQRDAAADTLAEKVEEIKPDPAAAAVTNAEGFADFTADPAVSLDFGMYLVMQKTRTKNAVYYEPVRPFLLMLPGVEEKDGNNQWVYEVKAEQKMEIKKSESAELWITKKISEYVDNGPGSNATFVFNITGYDGPGEDANVVYKSHAGISFDAESGTSDTVKIPDVPTNIYLEIEEEYSGNYTPDEKVKRMTPEELAASDLIAGKEVWSFEFDNTLNGSTIGSGIVNVYDNVDGKATYNPNGHAADE